MFRRFDRWQLLLAGLLALRLVSMAIVPLADTSEPRYAEIARLMAVSGDWITPWFEPSVPFWGKPPLAFWAPALSFKLFGITAFAARLPSWLVTLATLALVYELAKRLYDRRAARWATIIYATCLLIYVAAGAVLTDGFLTLGVTLSLVAFALNVNKPSRLWQYGFFLGLAIGLLAKGPLAVVIVGGALVPWTIWQRNLRASLASLPWVGGLIMVAVLVLPWYVAAELKTPGFLRYFIVGEHFLRFVDSGWAGDRYGTAHNRPHGAIWPQWVLATLPWGPVGIVAVLLAWWRRGWKQLRSAASTPWASYLICWMLFTPLFFTFSGNILWTYVMPALPAFAVLLGVYLAGVQERSNPIPLAACATALVPVLGIAAGVTVAIQPERLKTEMQLVEAADAARGGLDVPLVFVGTRTFSARFYSHGTAQLEPFEHLPQLIATAPVGTQLAVMNQDVPQLPDAVNKRLKEHFQNKRYTLFTVGNPRYADQ